MKENKLNYKVINALAVVALVYVIVRSISLYWGILGQAVSIVSPFIIGFAFAYAFTPLVRWLERKTQSRGLSVTIVVLGLVLIVFLLLWITLPLLYDQLSLLAKMVVEVTHNLSSKFDMNLGSYELEITDYINDMLKQIGSIASSTGLDMISKFIGFFSKFIIGFVAFIYFLIDMDKIRHTVRDWLHSISDKAFNYMSLMDTEITHYLKGLETFMVIQLLEYSLLFLIIGHPNWLILGILACITTVIPYFGGLITNLIALVLASVVSTKLFICTLIICLIFPQLDGYLISPKVYGKTNNVNPLVTILVVSIGGSIMGVPGIIAALPIYLLLRTTFNFFKPYVQQKVSMVKKTK